MSIHNIKDNVGSLHSLAEIKCHGLQSPQPGATAIILSDLR